MRAQLLPLDGSPPVDILNDMTLVGRKEECDVRLDHKSVSKMHCVIVKTDGLLLLRDLGSTNGTRVNGQRVRQLLAHAGNHKREALRPILAETGALAYAQRRAEEIAAQARTELACLPASPCRTLLELLTDRVVHRRT